MPFGQGHGNLDDYMPDGPQHGHLHDPRMANGIGADLGGGGILSRIQAEGSDPLQRIKELLAQLGAPADPLAGIHSNPMEGEHDPLGGFHSHFLQPADRGNPSGLAQALRGSHHSYQEPRARRSMLAHAAGGHGQMRAY